MDALKKLLEQAHALQEAELARLRIDEAPPRPPAPRGPGGWSSEAPPSASQWSAQAAAAPTQWSGQDGPRAWVDPATQIVRVTPQEEAVETPSIAQRLRDPQTLRTFFLIAEAFGPAPGLQDEDWD